MLRNFDAANKTIDRALALDPTAFGALEVKSKLAIAENGDFSVAEKAFEAVKSMPMTNEQKLKIASGRADVFLLERKYQDGLEAAESTAGRSARGFPRGNRRLWSKYYNIGFARKALQDEAGARDGFPKGEKRVPRRQLKQNPDAAESRTFSWQKCSRTSAKRTPRWRKRNARASCFPKAKTPLADRTLLKVWPKFTLSLARMIVRLKFWMDC